MSKIYQNVKLLPTFLNSFCTFLSVSKKVGAIVKSL